MSKVVLFLDKSKYNRSKADEVALLCGATLSSIEVSHYYIYVVTCEVIDSISPYSKDAVMLGIPAGMSMFCVYKHSPNSRTSWCKSVGLGVSYFKKAFDERLDYAEIRIKKTISFFTNLFNLSEEDIVSFKNMFFEVYN